MLNKTIKSVLAVAVVATGTALTATSSANAGANISVYVGGYYGGGYHGGSYYVGKHKHRHGYRYDHGPRHRGKCKPHRAVGKAYRMGVKRPHVSRVGDGRIVVKGFRYGHRAKVVFSRYGSRCPVIKTRGLH